MLKRSEQVDLRDLEVVLVENSKVGQGMIPDQRTALLVEDKDSHSQVVIDQEVGKLHNRKTVGE